MRPADGLDGLLCSRDCRTREADLVEEVARLVMAVEVVVVAVDRPFLFLFFFFLEWCE